ncbi:hypothetical protein SISNIDRAFT_301156 [Sistotremastrum niveocremeum HHB9708]|uniref:Uncharacterized protein n=1 Tax=Sistotremastrum niveocremeum HHB9708 TaxID=1314777 RepID=A0A164NAS9_9AGAM|nr:hypothetical protein SISNIDRAFT_301156 [Sistotremastrum niveocremeum HHB9708]
MTRVVQAHISFTCTAQVGARQLSGWEGLGLPGMSDSARPHVLGTINGDCAVSVSSNSNHREHVMQWRDARNKDISQDRGTFEHRILMLFALLSTGNLHDLPFGLRFDFRDRR